jgi:hypothetical protein
VTLAGLGFASYANFGWTTVPSPNATAQSINYSNVYINALTCISKIECWIVGYSVPYGYGGIQQLIERWDGTSWSMSDLPPDLQNDVSLHSVACVANDDCWAVGDTNTSYHRTVIEHWDGIQWERVDSPNTDTYQDNTLFGVACSSATECWAVGGFNNGTLIEHWDGVAWTIASSPSPSGTGSDSLFDVTCESASDCWAVGSYLNWSSPQTYQTLVEHWDGLSWNVVGSPNAQLSRYNSNQLHSVTCNSATDCWAVGYAADLSNGGYASLVEHWDGHAWSLTSSATNDNVTELRRVTCASANDCWIAGNSAGHTITQHWNGSSWSVVSSVDKDPAQWNALHGLACLDETDCWAVGDYSDYKAGVNQSLAEHWNGQSWGIVSSANPNKIVIRAEPNELHGVTCVSDSDCWAVGHVANLNAETYYSTLIEHWDGKEWTIAELRPVSDSYTELESVTCLASWDCWAAGYAGIQTLIEHWDGNVWTVVPSPSVPPTFNSIHNIACTSASDCWAVGSAGDNTSGGAFPLIERWDGTSWTVAAAPPVSGVSSSGLHDVACTSASECWAVGSAQISGVQRSETIIARWNGSTWVLADSPNPGNYNYLTGVSCASASDCWATGYYADGTAYQLLLEHWNGGSWSVVPALTSSNWNKYPENVTCASSSECWLVGYQNIDNGPWHPLIANWDGTAWAEIPSATSNDTGTDMLLDIACSPESRRWAVGFDNQDAFTTQTFIEQYISSSTPIYTIFANASPMIGGSVTGVGRYTAGSDVSVSATPNAGYNFANWTENGAVVSTSPTYNFTATSTRSLAANFVPYPKVTLSVSPNKIGKGASAIFTATATTINPSQALIVNYNVSGTAVFGSDYTLSGNPNQLTIPPGQSSGTITLNAITAATKGSEKATLTLNAGSGYDLAGAKKIRATVTIKNK